jgi:isochorismate pyruvate lyase|tara:strand:- start:203 stop:484 length:282 start_codon:yes stop_codon:yes gene_type:complete
MDKKKLKKARGKIDTLDSRIFELIKQRTNVVKEMLKLKENKNQIVDQKRIRGILSKIKKKSIKNNIDPKITARIWRSMIWSYVDYQKRKFSKK